MYNLIKQYYVNIYLFNFLFYVAMFLFCGRMCEGVNARVRDLEELAQKLLEFDDLYNSVDAQLGRLEAQAQARQKSPGTSLRDLENVKVGYWNSYT
jgi:hypothetical protein